MLWIVHVHVHTLWTFCAAYQRTRLSLLDPLRLSHSSFFSRPLVSANRPSEWPRGATVCRLWDRSRDGVYDLRYTSNVLYVLYVYIIACNMFYVYSTYNYVYILFAYLVVLLCWCMLWPSLNFNCLCTSASQRFNSHLTVCMCCIFVTQWVDLIGCPWVKPGSPVVTMSVVGS